MNVKSEQLIKAFSQGVLVRVGVFVGVGVAVVLPGFDVRVGEGVLVGVDKAFNWSCASWRGGHENMKSEPDADVFKIQLEDSPATRINNVKVVGSYALTIVWEDGHDYGIYNWHYLRALCPCPEDRAKLGK